MGIIYRATNIINGMSYIGKTLSSLEARKKRHLKSVQAGSRFYFHNAVRKHKPENFLWETIYECDGNNELLEQEKIFIKKFETFYGTGKGYNMTYGGDGGPVFFGDLNSSRRPEVKRLLSEITKRQIRAGRHPSQMKESRIKMSRSHINMGAKVYIVKTPDDREIKVKNMKRFCEENNLFPSNMYRVSSGMQSHHRGYTCFKMEE